MSRQFDSRSAIYAALGDPVRLRIVDELAASDRSPGELAEWLEMPTNLLAHHLSVLADAGIVERIASAGDARRRYVRLIPETLKGVWSPPIHQPEPALFVCSHNSARSKLACALWEQRTESRATSAGTHPAAAINPGAAAAAVRTGLELREPTPRHLDEVGAFPPIVVTVCDRAHEEIPGAGRWLHWSIPDPAGSDDPAVFDAVIDALSHRIDRFLGAESVAGTHHGDNNG